MRFPLKAKKKNCVEFIWVNLIIWSLFSLGFLTSVVADDQVLSLADYLFNSENYEDAITEYKRYIFFNPCGDQISYAYNKIGMAYRCQKRWVESLDAFRKSIHTASNDSVRDEQKIALGIVLIASGNYSSAELELLRLSLFSSYPSLRRKASFFLCVSCIYAFKWTDAHKAFRIFDDYDTPFNHSRAVDSFLVQTQKLEYKSPRVAKRLSTFLPGSGQIYGGDWRNGLNAFAINAATGYLFGDALLDKRFADALLNYLLLFHRYYRGNRSHAYTLAQDHNQSLNRKWAQKILEKLSENSP